MKYDFFSPNRIVFGWGRRSEVGTLAATLGHRAFLVCGSRTLERTGILKEIEGHLQIAGIETHGISVASHEPLVEDVDSLVQHLLKEHATPADCVIAVGGGSTIDLAKAAAALVTNRHGDSVADFLEGVGRGLQLQHRPLPLMAVPTTAGTGAEVTKNAVISSTSPPYKKSLRHDWMIPPLVVIDPELTVSLPASTTAYTGMDAITQLVESYISCRAAPIPRALSLSALTLALPALPVACREGTLRDAREAMAQAALLSGLALANSGLGLAHGVAAALGIQCGVPHGLACALMLPAALRWNRPACEAEFAQLEQLFAPPSTSSADDWVARIDRLCRDLSIPLRLREVGVRNEQIPALVRGSRGNSMSGNPRPISDMELTGLLQAMW